MLPLPPNVDIDRITSDAQQLQRLKDQHGDWSKAITAFANKPTLPDMGPYVPRDHPGSIPGGDTTGDASGIAGGQGNPVINPPTIGYPGDQPYPPGTIQNNSPAAAPIIAGHSLADVLGKVAASPRAVGLLQPLGAPRSTVVSRDQLPALLAGETQPVGRTVSQLRTGSSKRPSVDVALDHHEPLAPSVGTVVNQAEQYLATPFLAGGADPRKGLDGPGMLRYLYRQQGLNIPISTAAQMRIGDKIDDVGQLAPGDLIFIGGEKRQPPIGGFFVGNGQFLHATPKGDALRISSLNDPHYAERFIMGRRIGDSQ